MQSPKEMFGCEAKVERRVFGRTIINHGVMIYIAGLEGVHACCVRDVTNHGAGIRITGLNILSSDFGMSFDNFRTTRRCRLIWRYGDFIGAAFES